MAEDLPRVGWGFDAHRFGPGGPLVLCGIEVEQDRRLEATSDGDVATHAVIDALFGAGGIGDLGTHFGTDDPEMEGADSMVLLQRAVLQLADQGYEPSSLDVTIISESVRVAPHRDAMRIALAQAVGLDVGAVAVKATSTDSMGAIGRDEGVAAAAVAVISSHVGGSGGGGSP